MKNKIFLCPALICSLFTICLHAQDYAVGVKSYFIKDYARQTEGLAYRPILVNIWYPGEADTKKDYISVKDLNTLPGTDTTTSKFSEAYYTYVLKNLEQTLFSRLDDADSTWKDNALKMYLNTKTDAQRDLSPVKNKKFPLVIFHQGLGGTMDDNYMLCDLLAKKGFVVVGSTFFEELEYLSPGNFQISRNDVNMLINEMSCYAFVDLNTIYYIGHSYGAQGGFTIISQDGCPIDLFISLDTTFDHNDDKTLDEMWHYIMPTIKQGYAKVKIPSYHFVSKRDGNNYNVPKRHIYSERKIITTKKYITHNSFISIGYHEAKLIKSKIPDYDIDTSYYPNINKTILDILDEGPTGIRQTSIDTGLFTVSFHGVVKLFDNMSAYEPFIQENGLDSTLHFISFVNGIDPSTKEELGWLADYFIAKKDLVTAEKISSYYLEKYPEHWNSHFTKGKILVEKNAKEEAKPHIKKAIESTRNWFYQNSIREFCDKNEISFKK